MTLKHRIKIIIKNHVSFLSNEILLRGEVERLLSTLRSINAGDNFYEILFVIKINFFSQYPHDLILIDEINHRVESSQLC